MFTRTLLAMLLALPTTGAAEKGAVAWKRYDREQARCPKSAAASSSTSSGLDEGDATIYGGLLGSEAGVMDPEAQLLQTDGALVLAMGDRSGPTPLACPRGINWKRSAVVELKVPDKPKFAIKSVRRVAKDLIVALEHDPWCGMRAKPREIATTEYLVLPRGATRVLVESKAAVCKPSP